MISSDVQVTARTVANHYNDLSPFYLDSWGEHLHHGLWVTGKESPAEAAIALVRKVASEALIEKGTRVVDIGCGYGATARYLTRERGARVTGITVSEAQYEYALENTPARENPNFYLANWLENPFPDESFDVAIAIESTEHMTDKLKFLTEVRRVLKPGGLAVIAAWLVCANPKNWEEKLLLKPICREGRLASMASEEELRHLIRKSGLMIRNFHDLTRQVRRTWSVCLRRLVFNLVTKSDYRQFVFAGGRNHDFSAAVVRLWMAYAAGCLRYGLFTLRRPS